MRTATDVLTVREAAFLVGVTTQAVRDRIRAGRLAAQEFHGVMLVERDALDVWMAERRKREQERA
jgi:excisionase family DNA binding protein